jgi:hypothetical protein
METSVTPLHPNIHLTLLSNKKAYWPLICFKGRERSNDITQSRLWLVQPNTILILAALHSVELLKMQKTLSNRLILQAQAVNQLSNWVRLILDKCSITVSSKKLISSFDHLIILMETALNNPMLTSTYGTIEPEDYPPPNIIQVPS